MANDDLLAFAAGRKFKTILVDPPWRFQNRTGKMAPEHKRLSRYDTLTFEEIEAIPVASLADNTAHLYLWVPNALLPYGPNVMTAWGFEYKSNLIWHKNPIILFGVRGKNARTLAAGRRQVNYLASRKREHSRKPDEQYPIIEACSPGPFLEIFARGTREGWATWGNEAEPTYAPTWKTYAHHSRAKRKPAKEVPLFELLAS